MAKPLSILSKFFNQGDTLPHGTENPKKSLGDFSKELKELNDDEKRELAEMAGKELGMELDPK